MDMAGQLHVFGHYGYMLSMNGAQIGILQEAHHVILGSLLQCLDGSHLEMQVMCLLLLHYLKHQVCKRPLMDEELSASLIAAYLTESHHPWPVPPGLLQPTLYKLFVGSLPAGGRPHVPPPLNTDGAGPTSTAILASCLVGEEPSNLAAISNPLSCFSHPFNSSGYGGCLSKGVSNWVTLL